jgi:hypothetical protein
LHRVRGDGLLVVEGGILNPRIQRRSGDGGATADAGSKCHKLRIDRAL